MLSRTPTMIRRLFLVCLLLWPVTAYAQSGGPRDVIDAIEPSIVHKNHDGSGRPAARHAKGETGAARLQLPVDTDRRPC
jgi:hypothetical protein